MHRDRALRDRSPRPSTLPRWPDRLITASTFAAWACLALVVAGLVVGVVPVKNPKVQDCGTPLAFVLTGRVDTFVDPNSPPHGMTAKEAEAANRRPCRKRVAPHALLSGGLLLGALVVGLAGATMLVVGRSGRRRAILRDWPSAPIPERQLTFFQMGRCQAGPLTQPTGRCFASQAASWRPSSVDGAASTNGHSSSAMRRQLRGGVELAEDRVQAEVDALDDHHARAARWRPA